MARALFLLWAFAQVATFEAAYVGSNITHVGIPDSNINQLSVGQLALGAALNARVPNPFFGSIRSRRC